jgi:hypothetical protein
MRPRRPRPRRLLHRLVSALRLRVSGAAEVLRDAVPGRELGPDARPEETSRAGAYATRLSAWLQEHLDFDLALVIDDLHAGGAHTSPGAIKLRGHS